MNRKFYHDKIILLTGATGDLGETLARKLADAKARLIITSRSAEKLQQLADSISARDRLVTLTADLSRPGQADLLAERVLDEVGRVDILVNNAGLGYFALMEEVDEEKVRHLFEVNTFSPIVLIKALVPRMIEQGSGRIVNIVSSAGRVPIPTMGVYGGSKSALAVMANTMRLELKPKGIDIINIYPGTINDSFEQNALREGNRRGLCPTTNCGERTEDIAAQILEAAAGSSGEAWLEKTGKWLALASITFPSIVDSRLKNLRDRALYELDSNKPHKYRRWRLWQVESSLACNLDCIMCPWKKERRPLDGRGTMSETVWKALVPLLHDVRSVDFTGGGEPLLNPRLENWLQEAKSYGCEVGFLTNGLLLKPSLCDRLIGSGLDWICFSIDGADQKTYESIRTGSDFDTVCRNIEYLTAKRQTKKPLVMINFVIMDVNCHQFEDIVRLAADLGADQVNFKQCDVIRGEHGTGHGLFETAESARVKELQKALEEAERVARKLSVKTTAFSFIPEEQPVCDQDPRNSLFIRHDGRVSPCINLAVGGPSLFLGREVVFPHVGYGTLPEEKLEALWESETCRFYRRVFEQRVSIHDQVVATYDYGRSITKLHEAFALAIESMPAAPDGCRTCHYLFNI